LLTSKRSSYFLGVAVARIALGGSSTPLWEGTNAFSENGIAVDDTHVYWTDAYNHTVSRVTLDGGGFTILASEQLGVGVVMVDETTVYWTTETSVMKLPSCEGRKRRRSHLLGLSSGGAARQWLR
jgi:hypothetical protein